MALILSIETSGTAGSVAISQDGQCLGQISLNLANSHAETLGQNIEHLIRIAGKKKSELNAVALSAGPGSFTGLRIGASTAKGLCYGLDIPLIPIPTHEAMAVGLMDFVAEGDILIPMQDARRMEVYATVYQKNKEQVNVLRATTNYILDEQSFEAERANAKVWFIGDGSKKFSSIINLGKDIVLSDYWPSAEFIGLLAENRYQANDGLLVDTAYYTPFYLKPWVGNQTSPKK